MAKPFYSLDEVSAKLGKNADEIKQLVRDGALREFRDAGKVFFKADDVDKLAAAKRGGGVSSDTGEILLEPAEDAVNLDEPLPSLVDTSAGTSIIGLEPSAEEERPRKSDTMVPKSGIKVFDDDELEVDPLSKTTITSGAGDTGTGSGVLDSTGTASGLMDIAREADDTTLGAELLDEIYPGDDADSGGSAMKTATPVATDTMSDDSAVTAVPDRDDEAEAADEGEVLMPVMAAPIGDPTEGIFAGLLVGALLVVTLGSSVVAAVLQGFLPDYARLLTSGTNFWFFLGGAALTVGLSLLIGWLVGRSGSAPAAPRRR